MQGNKPGLPDIVGVRLSGPRQIDDVMRSRYQEANPHVSPDGRWIAYQSDESGQFEVYVRSFPDLEARKELVSHGGGVQPLWGRTGSNELFYRTLDGDVRAVSVKTAPDLVIDGTTNLFPGTAYAHGTNAWDYAVSPLDGRFLMLKPRDPVSTRGITIVVNWFEELTRLLRAS